MSSPIIKAEEITQVDIDFMNHTHTEEVSLVNTLGKAVKAYTTNPSIGVEISQQLKQWLEHTKAHFTRENTLMQETGFPAYPIHKNEHEIALKRLQTVIDNWENDKDIGYLDDYIFTVWPAWFKGHVDSMDLMTAKFAVMNGFAKNQAI